MISSSFKAIPARYVIPVFLLIVFFVPIFLGPLIFLVLQHFDVVFHRAMNRALSFSALVALFVFRRRLKIRQWWPLDRGAALQFALGWFIALVSAQLMIAVFLGIRGIESTGTPVVKSLLIAALAALIVPMLEETIFRGFVLTTLVEAAGSRAAWFFGALIYALAHFLKVPSEYHAEPVTLLSGAPAMLAAVTQFGTGDFLSGRGLNLFCIGLVLNSVFLRVGRLWLCAGLHGGWIFVLMSFSALSRPVWIYHAPWYAKGDLLGSPVTTVVVIAVGLFLRRYYPPRSDEKTQLTPPTGT